VTIWRLIPPLQAPGAVQMAVDTWLLDQHRQGLQPPTLRFYTWSPAAISLGYHQRHWPTQWHQLQWQGQPIDLVRRATGGRAVLHQGDVTYALVTSGLTGNRIQVYRSLCEFLIVGWRSLGVDLHFGQTGRGYIHNPNCFGTATDADLVLADGTKLVGSAQVYRDGAILQHGSIPLQLDAALFQQVFGVEPKRLPLPVFEEFRQAAGLARAIAALTQAAQDCFGITFQEASLSSAEWDAVLSVSPLELKIKN
jgi:lipoate---protein ligase